MTRNALSGIVLALLLALFSYAAYGEDLTSAFSWRSECAVIKREIKQMWRESPIRAGMSRVKRYALLLKDQARCDAP
ncbi:MAG: hypothetical protein WCK47_09500 [bacterium]|nr:hypothetical protein [Candidatus Sumerlaeota bacterium]